MTESIINPSDINIYGINAFINKFPDTKLDILDLELIKTNFDIDFKFDSLTDQIQEVDLPAFTQLSFNERISDRDLSFSTSYNRPPIGPIENFCYCSYCSNISPQYHAENCPFPEKKSLFLTLEGLYFYIIQNNKETFNKDISDLKEAWLNNSITKELLNKFLLIPNSVKFKQEDFINDKIISSKIPLNNTLTKIQYFDIIKLRGPTKLEYSTATQKFSNAIMLSYEYFNLNDQMETVDNSRKTSIRIYKNGLINLINIPNSNDSKDLLYKTLIDRINECSDNAVNIDNFNLAVDSLNDSRDKSMLDEYDEYAIIEKASYIHSINSQFNLWPIKDKYSIDFKKFNDLISPFNSSGKIVSGEYTTVSSISKSEKQQIKLNYKSNSVILLNWEYSLGKDTRTQSLTREEIKCIILPIDGIKISLQIHRHGTFQMSMSYCNASDLKNSICNTIVDKSITPLDKNYFNIIKNIFVGILSEKSNIIGASLDYSDDSSSNIIRNTVSGNAPPNKPGTSTAVCRSSDPRPGYPGLRPIPYSFNGNCPESRQYIDPIGILGNDGLYYPCCSSKTKKSDEQFKNYLKNGFPIDSEEAKIYDVNSIEDKKSGILVPGSINIGAVTKANLDGIWTPIKILNYKGKSKKPQEFEALNLSTNKIITVNRKILERDSRYIPGLKRLNKDQLIKCIIKNLRYKQQDMTILELENLNEIKKLINLPDPNFNPILSVNSINIFEKINYYVTSIPNNCNMYYFYIKNNNGYFINLYGNKIIKGLLEPFTNELVLLGYLENNSEKYFVTDILYFNKEIKIPFSEKIILLKEIQETYFLTENNFEFCEYENNIIKGSKDLLLESNNIFLIYTPEVNYLDFKIWNNISIEPEIILQIIKKVKTNYFTLGYEFSPINDLSISFNQIFIPKVFMESNQIKINDYILFKFDYNLQTGQLSSRILNPIEKITKSNMTLNQTLTKISLIINPIQESFFINNILDEDYIWNIPGKDKILKYVSDNRPLVPYV